MRDRRDRWFTSDWWRDHGRWDRYHWHRHFHYHDRPWYWWTWCTWPSFIGWVGGTWAEPIYYNYGYGGNVYYENNYVYVNGEQECTAEEYAQQAGDIATEGREALAEVGEDDEIEWMPLGVFALAHEEKGDAGMLLQLAVSKDGTIGGTYQNLLSDQTLPIQGAVDRDTQRAAWTIGDKGQTVMETGVYNLTKDETPVLVHFGTEDTQTWLLVRMEEPETEKDSPE